MEGDKLTLLLLALVIDTRVCGCCWLTGGALLTVAVVETGIIACSAASGLLTLPWIPFPLTTEDNVVVAVVFLVFSPEALFVFAVGAIFKLLLVVVDEDAVFVFSSSSVWSSSSPEEEGDSVDVSAVSMSSTVELFFFAETFVVVFARVLLLLWGEAGFVSSVFSSSSTAAAAVTVSTEST